MARTHVVVSDDVMKEIDARVGQRGRSRFIEDAAREKLQRLALEESLRESAGIMTEDSHPMWADRESTRDWVRVTRSSEAGRSEV